jgi:hypothetical protein
MNETMKNQGETLKILGARFNLNIQNPNIDPMKEEFSSHDVQVAHMFQDNPHP